MSNHHNQPNHNDPPDRQDNDSASNRSYRSQAGHTKRPNQPQVSEYKYTIDEFFRKSPPFSSEMVRLYASLENDWPIEELPSSVVNRGGLRLAVWVQVRPTPHEHYQQSVIRLPLLDRPNLRTRFLRDARTQNNLTTTSRCSLCSNHVLGFPTEDHQLSNCPFLGFGTAERMRFMAINFIAYCPACNSRSGTHYEPTERPQIRTCKPQSCTRCNRRGHQECQLLCPDSGPLSWLGNGTIQAKNEQLDMVDNYRKDHERHIRELFRRNPCPLHYRSYVDQYCSAIDDKLDQNRQVTGWGHRSRQKALVADWKPRYENYSTRKGFSNNYSSLVPPELFYTPQPHIPIFDQKDLAYLNAFANCVTEHRKNPNNPINVPPYPLDAVQGPPLAIAPPANAPPSLETQRPFPKTSKASTSTTIASANANKKQQPPPAAPAVPKPASSKAEVQPSTPVKAAVLPISPRLTPEIPLPVDTSVSQWVTSATEQLEQQKTKESNTSESHANEDPKDTGESSSAQQRDKNLSFFDRLAIKEAEDRVASQSLSIAEQDQAGNAEQQENYSFELEDEDDTDTLEADRYDITPTEEEYEEFHAERVLGNRATAYCHQPLCIKGMRMRPLFQHTSFDMINEHEVPVGRKAIVERIQTLLHILTGSSVTQLQPYELFPTSSLYSYAQDLIRYGRRLKQEQALIVCLDYGSFEESKTCWTEGSDKVYIPTIVRWNNEELRQIINDILDPDVVVSIGKPNKLDNRGKRSCRIGPWLGKETDWLDVPEPSEAIRKEKKILESFIRPLPVTFPTPLHDIDALKSAISTAIPDDGHVLQLRIHWLTLLLTGREPDFKIPVHGGQQVVDYVELLKSACCLVLQLRIAHKRIKVEFSPCCEVIATEASRAHNIVLPIYDTYSSWGEDRWIAYYDHCWIALMEKFDEKRCCSCPSTSL